MLCAADTDRINYAFVTKAANRVAATKGARSKVVNPWFWILVAPLAWSLGLCAIAYAREPDWRILPAGGLLLALGLVQWTTAPTQIGFQGAQLALDQQLAALAGLFGLNVLAGLAAFVGTKSVIERNRAERRRWLNLDALRGLSRHAVSGKAEIEPAFREILEIGCRQLACEIGIISRVKGEAWEIRALHGPLEFEPGDRLALRATFCEPTLSRKRPTTWAHPEPAPPGNPLRFARYIGVPLWLWGEITGTVCFARREAAGPAFSVAEIQSAALIAQVVTSQLANAESEATGRKVEPSVPHEPTHAETRRLDEPVRLAVDPSVLAHEASLKRIVGTGAHLHLQLDAEDAEIAMPEEDFQILLEALLFHAAKRSGDSGGAERFTLESSRIEGEADTGKTPSFATISIHAADCQPSALEFARLFEGEEPLSSEPPALSLIRTMLQEIGGDLSGQSAAGIGLTLTAFLPLPTDDDEAKGLLCYPLP